SPVRHALGSRRIGGAHGAAHGAQGPVPLLLRRLGQVQGAAAGAVGAGSPGSAGQEGVGHALARTTPPRTAWPATLSGSRRRIAHDRRATREACGHAGTPNPRPWPSPLPGGKEAHRVRNGRSWERALPADCKPVEGNPSVALLGSSRG